MSGGVAGARRRTLMVMYAGTDEDCARVEPVLAGLSDRRRKVGDRPGQAQALKPANNFLSATALAATSEAVFFGRAAGLDPTVMLEVLNASSGRSGASADKFLSEVLTGRYSAGFSNTLMAKDVRLCLDEVRRLGGARTGTPSAPRNRGPTSPASIPSSRGTDTPWQRCRCREGPPRPPG